MRDLGYFGRSVRQQNQKANKSGLGWPRFAPAAAGLRQRLPSSSTSSSSHLLLLLSQCQPCPVPAMVVRWWEQSLHLNPTVSSQRQTLSPLCCVDPPAHGIPLWGSQPTPSLHRDLSPPCPGQGSSLAPSTVPQEALGASGPPEIPSPCSHGGAVAWDVLSHKHQASLSLSGLTPPQ